MRDRRPRPGHAALPFERIVTIQAKMASKADFFEDPEVRRLLVRHGYRVHLTRMGSRGIATQRYDGYDIVFPSGQPAADLITSRRAAEGHPATTYRPFVSPIVLGTYREYAETLREAGIATPLPGVPAGAEPMYYSLDMRKFLGASAAGRRWDDLGTAPGAAASASAGTASTTATRSSPRPPTSARPTPPAPISAWSPTSGTTRTSRRPPPRPPGSPSASGSSSTTRACRPPRRTRPTSPPRARASPRSP
ncbi:hypothetical protein ACFQ3Z_26955 [Streptomyces nogalater]